MKRIHSEEMMSNIFRQLRGGLGVVALMATGACLSNPIVMLSDAEGQQPDAGAAADAPQSPGLDPEDTGPAKLDDDSDAPDEGGVIGTQALPYPVVDSGQTLCYGAVDAMACPAKGEAFHGQDAQHVRFVPSYVLSADGLTVADQVTGLTWVRSTDTDGDGVITAADKLTATEAHAYPDELNAMAYGGYDDWRLPTIKELYSLILFTGTDPSGLEGDDTSGLVPFIDTSVFQFGYGDTSAGERIIDAQYASSTYYVSTTMNGDVTLFGVNFADGRIKGYGTGQMPRQPAGKTFFVQCVRGNPAYGVNDLVDNHDGTVSDLATGLQWAQEDSGAGRDWEETLAWVAERNAEGWLGHSDWRLPGVKELQSIVDYSRSPETTGSAALDPLFGCSAITNEAGQADFPSYWASTTHAAFNGKGTGTYVSFGRALGHMFGSWLDVHGAGSQRSDPKVGDPSSYPFGKGPQGDAIRIYNHARLVRDIAAEAPLEAWFTFAPTMPGAGQPVSFTDGSGGAAESWAWSFGDGATSTEQSPTHAFATAGAYPVSLTVSGAGGSSTAERLVTVAAATREPGGGGRGRGGPATCAVEVDCMAPGACPPEAELGCTCAEDPQGSSRCIPLCDTDADCPKPPGMTLVCAPDGVCVPQ